MPGRGRDERSSTCREEESVLTDPIDHADADDQIADVGHEEEENEAENDFTQDGHHRHVGHVMLHGEDVRHEAIFASD